MKNAVNNLEVKKFCLPLWGVVEKLVSRLAHNQQVGGSIPSLTTRFS